MALPQNELLLEYIKKIKLVYMPLLKIGAYNRFDIEDGQIVGISRFTRIYSFIVMLAVDICGYMLYIGTKAHKKFLILPELISVIEFLFMNHTTLLSIHLGDRHAGANFFRNFIKIDRFLGIKETKFMRDITDKYILFWIGFILVFEIFVITVLVITFQLPIIYNVIGFIFFMIVFCIIYDHVFHVTYYNFLCLRVHYMNVALVKIADLDEEYITDQLLSYPLFWKKQYDESVDFHIRTDTKYITEVFKMLIDQMQRIVKSHQYLIFDAVIGVIMSTILAVQAIILYIKDPEMPVIRTIPLTGWFLVVWCVFSLITNQMIQFNHQTQCTKLICTYIQLSPEKPDSILNLSRQILDVLSLSDCRISIYGLFYLDGSLLRSIATSVFIYITMQFQIAFPTKNDQGKETTHTLT